MDRLDNNSAQCNICGIVKNFSVGATTNLNNYIFNHHNRESLLKILQRERREKFDDKIKWDNQQNKDSLLDNIVLT